MHAGDKGFGRGRMFLGLLNHAIPKILMRKFSKFALSLEIIVYVVETFNFVT